MNKENTATVDYTASFYNIWQQEQGKYYIMNTFTRAIIEVVPEEKEYITSILENDNSLIRDKKFLDYRDLLISQGFMVNSKYDERKILAYCYHEAHFSDKKITLTILPTTRCNFKCPYCFETEKGLCWNDESVNRLKQFAEKAFPGKTFVQLAFFGGEPLLEWNRIQQFLDYCMELKQKHTFEFYTGITTNGYLLDNVKAGALIDKYSGVSFQITMDGCRRTHDQTRVLKNGAGTFSQVLANFKSLLKLKAARPDKNIHIALRLNLLNNSLGEVEEFLSVFDENEKKLFHVLFRPVYNTQQFCIENENNINLEEFYKLLDKNQFKRTVTNQFRYVHCEGDSGMNTMVIMPDLTLWKCMTDTDCNDAKVGNITENGTMKMEIEKIEKWSRNDPFANADCKDCTYLPLCFGGCPLKYLKTSQKTCFYERNFNLVKHFLN